MTEEQKRIIRTLEKHLEGRIQDGAGWGCGMAIAWDGTVFHDTGKSRVWLDEIGVLYWITGNHLAVDKNKLQQFIIKARA